MFHMLIVDDEPHAVHMIATGMDWEALSVSRIHTAHNIRQAKQLYEQFPVHMMICDIEMPQGSGLELLEWTKTHYPDSESVFLTCHSDFQYARKAVKLGSLDYMLKPVQFDELHLIVEKGLTRVLERTRQRAEQEKGQYLGKLLQLQMPIMMERFWQDLWYERISCHPAAVEEAIRERHLPIHHDEQLIPVIIVIQRWTEKLSQREEKMMEYALLNAAEHAMLPHVMNKQAVRLSPDMLLVLIPPGSEEQPATQNELIYLCESYMTMAEQYFRCELTCYVGELCRVDKLQQQFGTLMTMRESKVSIHKVTLLERTGPKETAAATDLALWLELLKKGEHEALLREADTYMDKLTKREQLSVAELQAFLQSFLQILYHFIQSKGRLSYEVLGNVLTGARQAEAVRSVSTLRLWVMEAIRLTMADSKPDNTGVMTRLKSFVRQQLDQPISREDVAAFVNLHPDYLSRWFKKETGKSVTAYIIEEKMMMAKELLAASKLSVSDVALSVGYSNFSYFAKLFKQESGMNPNQYRKATSQNRGKNRSDS